MPQTVCESLSPILRTCTGGHCATAEGLRMGRQGPNNQIYKYVLNVDLYEIHMQGSRQDKNSELVLGSRFIFV